MVLNVLGDPVRSQDEKHPKMNSLKSEHAQNLPQTPTLTPHHPSRFTFKLSSTLHVNANGVLRVGVVGERGGEKGAPPTPFHPPLPSDQADLWLER